MAWGFSSPVGSIFLKAGEVWKYGKTINPTSRYTQRFLISTGLYFKAELMGSEQFVLSTERKWILRYLNRFGKLPPGNKAIK